MKMWYLYTMVFYSAMKKNEILVFASKLMELKYIILSEVSQAQKTKNHMFSPHICTLDVGQMQYCCLRGEHTQEEWGLVGNPKLESV
jgi:hypothetical protein